MIVNNMLNNINEGNIFTKNIVERENMKLVQNYLEIQTLIKVN